ncbi:MAG: prolipoprotein diacylglyceryl transferase [candidate division NC10 bacterium]|nr:prolipoprotein diacylglyceryl transferase [candidate division NC10 bacterium]
MYPVLFQLGPLSIRSWGVLVILAFFVGTRVAAAEARRKGLEPDLVHDFSLWGLLGGVAGAHLYEVLLLDPAWYGRHPVQILTRWQGGMALCGALLGGTVAAILFTRRRRIGFWRFADVLAPGLILGQAFGRLGSFLDGEAYGVPTTLPWGVTYSDPNGLAPPHVQLHPVQV